jgi:hypothetical protein
MICLADLHDLLKRVHGRGGVGQALSALPGQECARQMLSTTYSNKKVVSVADQGCLSGVPDTNFSIPGPVHTPGPGMCASNALHNLLKQKRVVSVADPGC